MASAYDIEGALSVEIAGSWVETYCVISGVRFQAYKKIRKDVPASRSNKSDEVLMKFDVHPNECECKRIKYGIAELTRIMKSSNFSETPFFFCVVVGDNTFMMASDNDRDRSRWLIFIKTLAKPKERKSNEWISTGFLQGNYNMDRENRFGSNQNNQTLPSQKPGRKMVRAQSTSPGRRGSLDRGDGGGGGMYATADRAASSADYGEDLSPGLQKILADTAPAVSSGAGGGMMVTHRGGRGGGGKSGEEGGGGGEGNRDDGMDGEEGKGGKYNFDDYDDEGTGLLGLRMPNKILGVKTDTLVRLLKVCSAFPFVIVVSALNLSNKYAFLRSVVGIRVMNVLIYVAPVVYVRYGLSQTTNVVLQRLLIGMYIVLYLLPVGYVVSSKVKVASSTSNIEEGTFCFKPARTVRVTQANFYALFGFCFEWVQHILYVLPLGIVTSDKATKLSDYPPYLSFEVYFWGTVVCTMVAGLIIVLNAVLKGKIHYRFQNSYVVWFFVFNVGSPLYVSFVTILFMSLWCDYDENPPTLIQQPSITCYSERHITMARGGLVAVAIYIIQHTLLPSGTFKETMRDNDLDIMFVPVYLQAHFLLKAIFYGIYVYFYQDNLIRVSILTFINIVLLALNNFMKPCSVGWINVLRDAFFVHAVLAGIQSLNYLAWPINVSTKSMVISTLASNLLFSSVGMYIYYKYFSRSTEYTIAMAFLDLEWQVSRGGSVHPRVLEPLISLTLSPEKPDWDIGKNYIGQLVWLISYPNMRVQFQSAWGLANLALLDEDARIKIHQAGGTKTLFEWYMDMEPVVQLEVLAALANLTLSLEVSEDMVVRNKCITFFIDLVSSNKLKHSQFAAIALSNLARRESFRELIRRSGGIAALVGCIMSHDYQKRRHGARALANMALSPAKDIEQVFESLGLLDRIIKMALRKETETQREVLALIRNLCCHARLRPLLLERGVMEAVDISRTSVFPDVITWCDEITVLLEKEISGGSIDLKALIRREGAKGNTIGEADVDLLRQMKPLEGRVEWSTWGSKLEMIFSPVFSALPNLIGSQVITLMNVPVPIHLPAGLSKATLRRWRDSLSYVVVEKPAHGKLSELVTSSDSISYTPNPGHLGTDFFTYHMRLGSLQTNMATVAINVCTAEEAERQGMNLGVHMNPSYNGGVADIEAGAQFAGSNPNTMEMVEMRGSRRVGSGDSQQEGLNRSNSYNNNNTGGGGGGGGGVNVDPSYYSSYDRDEYEDSNNGTSNNRNTTHTSPRGAHSRADAGGGGGGGGRRPTSTSRQGLIDSRTPQSDSPPKGAGGGSSNNNLQTPFMQNLMRKTSVTVDKADAERLAKDVERKK